MQIEYIQSGDYQIPNLIGNREPEGTLTKYGLMRRNFLKEHRSGIYSGLGYARRPFPRARAYPRL